MAGETEAASTGAPGSSIEQNAPPRTGKPVVAPRSGFAAAKEALAMRDFRFLLLGNAMMFAGFQVRNMGQAWLVLDLTDSSLWVGIVNAMPGIAIISISLVGGAVADRAERWKVQAITKLVIASMAFLTAFLITSGVIQPWQLIPIGLVTGSMFAFHNPASQAFAMDVVGRERFLSAVSLNTTISQTANIVGPSLGGFLLAAGLDAAFYLLGALYGTGFIATILIKTRSAPKQGTGKRMTTEIREGLKYVAGVEVIRWLLFISAGGIFNGIFMAMIPLFARNVLDVGEVGYGTMLTVQGLGTMIGALGITLAGDIRRKGLMIFVSMLILNTGIVIFALSDIYLLSLSALVLVGAGMGTWFITVPTLIQTRSDPEVRGRVMGIFFMIALIFQLGWIAGGALDTAIGTRQAALIAAGGSLVMVLIAFGRSRELRHVS
jgi:MFS family permease